jgi:hypothetical protein
MKPETREKVRQALERALEVGTRIARLEKNANKTPDSCTGREGRVQISDVMGDLLKASIALRDDLLMRAEIEQPAARKVVACGASAWIIFNSAIDRAALSEQKP